MVVGGAHLVVVGAVMPVVLYRRSDDAVCGEVDVLLVDGHGHEEGIVCLLLAFCKGSRVNIFQKVVRAVR